jgi:hypothetical protein
MKAIAKLVFVLLLVTICLSLPTRVKAGGTYYYCESAYLGECIGSLDQWMGQCAYGCTSGGGNPSQQCYTTTYSYTDGTTEPCPGNPTQQCEVTYLSSYQGCYTTNNPSCVGGCVNEYNEQYGNCFTQYCEQEE